jgi:hypothetical protein
LGPQPPPAAIIDNISYAANYIFPSPPFNLGDIVQFTGQLEGWAIPSYIVPSSSPPTPDAYDVFDQDIAVNSLGNIFSIMVAQNLSNSRFNIFVVADSTFLPIPGWVGGGNRVAINSTSMYLYTANACQ